MLTTTRVLAFLPALALAASAHAQLSISSSVIAGGGTTSESAGQFTISATSGQPAALGAADTADTFDLYAGFWSPAQAAPACDPDTNQDGVTDQGDVDYLINIIAGADNPTNIEPDFNRDGVADQGDIDSLINVIAGGPCP